MIDESSDISNQKELAIIVRYFNEDTMKVSTEFLTLLKLEGQDAKYLRTIVTMLLRSLDLCLYNLMGISTDGASVMIGSKSGLCTRLQKYCPYMLQFHCSAHRLNLAFKDVANTEKALDETDSLVRDLYKFFKNSSTRYQDLERFAKILGNKVYKIMKIYDIRWLSRHNSYKSLVNNYAALLDLLLNYQKNKDEKESLTAKALYLRMSDIKIIYLIFGLNEMLSHWASILEKFQSENLSASMMAKELQVIKNLLSAQYVQKDIPTNDAFIELDGMFTKKNSFIVSHKIGRNNSRFREACTILQDIADSLITNIDDRFPNQPMLNALTITDLHELLDQECDEDVALYGISKIRTLVDHFVQIRSFKTIKKEYDYYKPEIDADDVVQQYSRFKFMVYLNYKEDSDFKIKSSAEQWALLMKMYSSLFPQLFKIIKIAMIQPMSTVTCERLFSKKNLIKTRTRNRLRTKTLDILLRGALSTDHESPQVQRETADHFLLSSNRFIAKYSRYLEQQGERI
jgi:hypothetical protein